MDTVSRPGASIGREIAGWDGEMAEVQIDAFISRRDQKRRASEGGGP